MYAIIVGASSAIGKEVCKILLKEGWTVGITTRDLSKIKDLVGVKSAICLDVNEENATVKLKKLIEETGGMDLYLHVSGIGKQNPYLNEDIELQTVKTNALGFTRMIDFVFNYMAKHKKGHIAVISSIAGTKGIGVSPAYSATKVFDSTYIESLEQLAKMRELNISFTDIRPGFVDTPLLEGDYTYPMMMKADYVARMIVKALKKKKSIIIIDWKYKILVFFWRLIPHCLWVRMNIGRITPIE